MRSIVAAVALVLAIGVVLPTETDARAPRKVEKWGCTIRAVPFRLIDENGVIVWYADGLVRDCDDPLKGTVALSLREDTPAAPDRVVYQEAERRLSVKPGKVGRYRLLGFCRADVPAPTAPLYMQMKVKRASPRGSATVATTAVANPCPDGTYPIVLAP